MAENLHERIQIVLRILRDRAVAEDDIDAIRRILVGQLYFWGGVRHGGGDWGQQDLAEQFNVRSVSTINHWVHEFRAQFASEWNEQFPGAPIPTDR